VRVAPSSPFPFRLDADAAGAAHEPRAELLGGRGRCGLRVAPRAAAAAVLPLVGKQQTQWLRELEAAAVGEWVGVAVEFTPVLPPKCAMPVDAQQLQTMTGGGGARQGGLYSQWDCDLLFDGLCRDTHLDFSGLAVYQVVDKATRRREAARVEVLDRVDLDGQPPRNSFIFSFSAFPRGSDFVPILGLALQRAQHNGAGAARLAEAVLCS